VRRHQGLIRRTKIADLSGPPIFIKGSDLLIAVTPRASWFTNTLSTHNMAA
jgi:hypothetical protein